ncbi:hypothetical protein RFZ44_27150, partial [Acinetobacter sp. 163]|nr:hypothetical protein [Acinetobacter sp. 163]
MIYERTGHPNHPEEAVYASAASQLVLPKYRIPQESSPAGTILEILKDELNLDGNAKQNLATFCQTYEDDAIR